MITLNSSSPETYIRKHSFKFLVQFGVEFIRNNVFTIDKILIPKINLRVWISPPNCIRIVASLHQYGNCFFRDCNVPWIEFWAKDFTKSSILPITILSKFAHSHLLKLQSNSSLVNPASYPFLLSLSSIMWHLAYAENTLERSWNSWHVDILVLACIVFLDFSPNNNSFLEVIEYNQVSSFQFVFHVYI